MISRRSFIQGILAAGVAPAVVKAENLMKIWVPPTEIVTGPGLFIDNLDPLDENRGVTVEELYYFLKNEWNDAPDFPFEKEAGTINFAYPMTPERYQFCKDTIKVNTDTKTIELFPGEKHNFGMTIDCGGRNG